MLLGGEFVLYSILVDTLILWFMLPFSLMDDGEYCAGALLNKFVGVVWMLILCRSVLGFGIGFANQVKTSHWMFTTTVLDESLFSNKK